MHRYIPISIPDDFEIGQSPPIVATIDSDLIDSTLTNFPVGIEIASTGWLTGKETTDWQNLHAVVGGAECYIEVDRWDVSGDKAILWVKVPSISSSADTQIQISIGADNTTTYVGETGSTAAQNVWDSNFSAVYHMSQDPSGGSGAILDSTSNENNGTSAGTMTSGDLVDAGFGKALDFDGTDDYISYGDILDSVFAGSSAIFTIEGYLKPSPTAYSYICSKYNSSTDNRGLRYYIYQSTGTIYVVYEDKLSGDRRTIASNTTIPSTSYSLFAAIYDATQGDTNNGLDRVTHYFNGQLLASTISDEANDVTDIEENSANFIIGGTDNGGLSDESISEIRISNTARSAAWIKATNAVLAKTLVTLS